MGFRFHQRLAATAVLAALALPAFAQQPPSAAPAPASGASATEAGQKAGERREQRHARMAEHRTKRLAALKSQLKLSSEQEAAWTTYTTALQPGERHARMDRKEMEKLTTPERIDRMRALRTQHAAEADRRGDATKAFYAALTPEQQKTFDAKARWSGGHHHHMKGHDGHRGHGGHHGMRKEAEPAPAK